MSRFLTFCTAFSLAATALLPAADWTGWRGPDGLGVSSEKKLPMTWSGTTNVQWKIPSPGKGASSPIIVRGRVYLTYQTPDTALHLLAVEAANGKLIWDKKVGEGKLPANQLHNMATPTPVSDGRQVWALFGTGDLVCLNWEGQVVWSRNLVKEFGPYKTNHGMGTSPVLYGGKLFIACMHQAPSYFLAIDAKSGKDLWKKSRDLKAREEGNDSYSTPIVFRGPSGTELILAGAEHLNAYDPKTGAEIWTVGGLDVPHPYGRTIAGPTAGDSMIVAVASGFQNRGYTVGVKAGGRGDITATHKAWTSARYSPDCPSPLIYNGLLFCLRDDGNASCLNAKTGEIHWQERLFSENAKVSPVAGDGKVYFTSGRGNCFVIKADPKLEILARNDLNEDTLSTPAISGGRILQRTDKQLYCFGPAAGGK